MPQTNPSDKTGSVLPEGGKARRVYLHLREEIARGRYAEGTLLPGEQRLAAELDVSRVTIRRALDVLVDEEVVERRAGAGTRVCAVQDKPAVAADFSTLMPQVARMGQDTSVRLMSFSYGAPPAFVARAMGLVSEVRVQTAVRLRLVEGQAFSHLTTHVPEAFAQNYSESELATTPLYELLERSGVKVETAHQSVTATLAAPDVADLLGVSVGAPLLALERTLRDAEGRGVEHLSALYRPDMFRLEMSLSHVGAGEARHWEPVIAPVRAEAAE